MPKDPWCHDCRRQSRGTPASVFGVAKERAKRTSVCLHRDARITAIFDLLRKKRINWRDANRIEHAIRFTKMTEEIACRDATLRDGPGGQPAFCIHISGIVRYVYCVGTRNWAGTPEPIQESQPSSSVAKKAPSGDYCVSNRVRPAIPISPAVCSFRNLVATNAFGGTLRQF